MSGHAWPALAALAGALLSWPSGGVTVRHRLRGLAESEDAAEAAAGPRRRWLLASAAGLAAGLLVGGATGGLAAVAVTVAGERLLRRAADDERHAPGRLTGELAVACDLLAVCLAGGLPVGGALAAVGAAVPGPLGAELARVAGLYRLGAEPRRAWADAPAELAPLGRTLVRAGESGSTVVPALRSLAADTRAAARAASEADVRRAGVWVLAPLGLCFLPAFVCLGVVPLVLGIASDVFG